ncbi:MAG: class I SAM-dependent methyltransferase [Thermodesulfobacteriota bacterium]|nr:class I SAM-dependent methyltransferase [Thermodesulfobacteriota bacterium]
MNFIKSEITKRKTTGDDSRRLFHGRGHCFPGYEDLVIDWFKPVVLVTLYQQRDDFWLVQLVSLLHCQLVDVGAIILQERYLPGSPSRILSGELPAEINAVEAGLIYRLRLNGAQNIGFFPDMAQGRALVREIGQGKKVLNLFSYTCSFSVAALSAGATQVVNLDMNRGALKLGKLNHRLNGLDIRKASFLPIELFRSFSRLRKLTPFDLIVCDPPTEQGGNFQAQRDWPKMIRKLPSLLSPGGEILACLSSPYLSPDEIQQLFVDLCPQAKLLQIINSGADFPEIDQPKGMNLLHYQID